jgi:hypothetical protein
MQRTTTTLIQQLIVVMILGVTTLVHAQTACQPSTTEKMPKSLIQTQRSSSPENQTILTATTQLNNCEFSAADSLTITDFVLKGDTHNRLTLISTSASGPQSLVHLFRFSCANCSTKKEGLDLRVTQTVKAYANNNGTCNPNYLVKSAPPGAIYLQALKGCESLGIEHLLELVQTGPVMSADPYVFNTSLATFKLSRPSNPTPIEHTITLNSKAFLISPCKVVLRRSVKRL